MTAVSNSDLDGVYLDPSRVNFEAFKALPRDEPIDMLNMLLFRSHAVYPDYHVNSGKGWTGQEAYKEYGRTSGPIFQRVGGSIIWSGRFQTMVIGPDGKQWDRVFIARYPNTAAFLEMVTDAEYQRAVVNRTAALTTSRLMRLKADDSRNGTFG
jgi:uncharacterized protein (DUF1330 family)